MPTDRELTDAQKDELADALHGAWSRYVTSFGTHPHGTRRQLRALVEFIKVGSLIQHIEAKAVSRWYAEGQGKGNHDAD